MYLPHPPKGEPLRQARCSGSLAYWLQTETMKTTSGSRAVGGTGINIKTVGDSATSMATSTGKAAIAGDGITGGFMVWRAPSITTARPATIEFQQQER